MDVYLIPIGRDRWELYCEPSSEVDDAGEQAPRGVIGRLRHRFAEMVHAAEERQKNPPPADEPSGRVARAQERMLAWVAERIAEQRLLWHLRRHDEATLVHPQDVPAGEALRRVREALQRDYDRHRRWLIVDLIAFLASGAFMLVPGPNLIAYFFAFRVWGHWLSMRGSTQGLTRIAWTSRPCPVLSELREVAILDPPVRTARLHDIAERLRLPHLATFFERLAVHHA